MVWKSNTKAWVTFSIFQDWFIIFFFCPAVECYYTKHNISNKALLLLDNASSHPVNSNDLSDSIKVEYIQRKHDNLAPANGTRRNRQLQGLLPKENISPTYKLMRRINHQSVTSGKTTLSLPCTISLGCRRKSSHKL